MNNYLADILPEFNFDYIEEITVKTRLEVERTKMFFTQVLTDIRIAAENGQYEVTVPFNLLVWNELDVRGFSLEQEVGSTEMKVSW
jgi:hypothetical protein